MSSPFDSAPVIFRSTRRIGIADGVLVDATRGDFAEISREHFPNHHLSMTSDVLALIDAGMQSDDGAEFAGIWHVIRWMSRVCPVRQLAGVHTFKVGIRAGRALH